MTGEAALLATDTVSTHTASAMVGTCHSATDTPTEVWSARLPASTATRAWPPIIATWTIENTGARIAAVISRIATT